MAASIVTGQALPHQSPAAIAARARMRFLRARAALERAGARAPEDVTWHPRRTCQPPPANDKKLAALRGQRSTRAPRDHAPMRRAGARPFTADLMAEGDWPRWRADKTKSVNSARTAQFRPRAS